MNVLGRALLGAGAALAIVTPAVADDNRRPERHDDQHEQIEERHDDRHERLEDRHDRAHERDLTRREHRRVHNRLEQTHDQTHGAIEQRHVNQHDRNNGYNRGYGYDRGYDNGRYGGYEQGYGRNALRGDGWYRLGWIARDPRLSSWVLANFDRNRNGSLGTQEAQYAEREIHRMADRDRDGRLTQRELAYWRASASRY